ncbi:MAG: autotransporter domain-containing protein [Desulfovibrio desulfuricans]|nr:autotransporter domain-containing protein [Desulfovibrio desulfuricans]
MQMGDLKVDVTSHAWNTGLKAEYKFNAGALDIISHGRVRYLGLMTDGYDVKSGSTVFEGDESTQSIWTFPVGVSFAKAFETENGWQIKPQLDLELFQRRET